MQKEEILSVITALYHELNGVVGYRTMKIYLEEIGYFISANTVHRYMNTELGLKALSHSGKPKYQHGKPHRVFDDLIKHNFTASAPNQKWCTDFTYIKMRDGTFRYNCVILDLYDRSIMASVTARHITAELAIKTLQKALYEQKLQRPNLILHSDQGVQYTSKEFVLFCKKVGVRQSMSRAGTPTDNAVMERYMKNLKQELIYIHTYDSAAVLNRDINDFVRHYNTKRPHKANGGLAPLEKRYPQLAKRNQKERLKRKEEQEKRLKSLKKRFTPQQIHQLLFAKKCSKKG